MAATSDALELTSKSMSVGLEPGIGGSVSHFRYDNIDLMRGLAPEDRLGGDALGVAMFPMMPYANRIAGNQFTFGGRTWRVEPNNGTEKFNVHGTGWQRPWTVASVSATETILTLAIDEPDTPYSYRASQHFILDEQGLAVSLAITNTGPVPMPFGFGLHPWFERDADVSLQFAAKRFYLEEPEGVSGDAISLPAELDFATARPLPHGWRNNDYGGWEGVATLRFPSRGLGLTMSADPLFRHLMIYADPAKPYFCIEPQTNASGALNRPGGFDDPDEGVIVLGPEETATGSVHFQPFRL